MPFSRLDRKVALTRLSVTNQDIAAALGVHASLVSHVIAGRRWEGKDGRRVMQHVADLIGAPVGEVFPGWDRRRGADRRDPFGSKAA